jgi:hypothetical protein
VRRLANCLTTTSFSWRASRWDSSSASTTGELQATVTPGSRYVMPQTN